MRLKTWLAVVTLSASSLTAVQALACGNTYRYELDLKTKVVVAAENYLQAGNYKEAISTAEGALSKKNAKAGLQVIPFEILKREPLDVRALRVVAISKIQQSKGLNTPDVIWAVGQLRELNQHENSPYLESRIAEGLGKSAEGKAEALKIFKSLVDEDLMPDAHAWFAYSQLLEPGSEREDALKKCQLRAKNHAECGNEKS